MKNLQLGCKPLDNLLGGGIESGIITKIYGEAATGKTNLCLQASRECASIGYKVAFIDTEGVSIERLSQICTEYDYKKILENILFFSPTSFDNQEKMINEATKIKNLGLIIVDTLNLLYRVKLEENKEGEQVYTDKNGNIKPFTNRDTEHMAKTIIKLDKIGIGERQATIIKHRSQPEGKKTLFRISAVCLE